MPGASSKQISERINGQFHVVNDSMQSLPFESRARMHGDNDPSLIRGPYVNGMAPAPTPQDKARLLCYAGHLLSRNHRELWAHAGISMGLMRMSSSGTGRPSSTRLSM